MRAQEAAYSCMCVPRARAPVQAAACSGALRQQRNNIYINIFLLLYWAFQGAQPVASSYGGGSPGMRRFLFSVCSFLCLLS